ncbi:hypothetical protein Tco_1158509 [Tanacetum coccineum]
MESQSETTQTVSALKLPILKTGDYDLWSMRMEQYLTHTDYALWEVIMNGDACYCIALKHLLKFYGIKDAKTLWEAIKAKFRGNKESKKMQKTILKQQYENFTEDANLKLLRSLPSAWNNIALIMRNKADLDELSMDDLYNNLKVYKAEIKSQSSSSSNSQNVAFVSSDYTSSTNEAVNTAHDVPAPSLINLKLLKHIIGHAYHEGEEILKEDRKESELQWQRNWHQGIRGIEMEMLQKGMHQWIHLLQMPWFSKMG